MVLGTKTAQYAFLQTLASTYVSFMESLQSLNCMASPQVYTDCTDLSGFNQNLPRLPTYNDFSSAGTTYEWDYTDYSSVTWSGLTATSFAAISANLTKSTVTALIGACAGNTTCAHAFNTTAGASDVIVALAQTNVNTIQSQINLYAKKKWPWFPSTSYAYFSNAYAYLPGPGDEVYGMHNAVTEAFANGTLDPGAYVRQLKLGAMLWGGAAMYESLIHTAAIGSWSYDSNKQSNINLTAPQVFKKVDSDYGLDSRDASLVNNPNSTTKHYKTKWEVWRDEARGIAVPDKARIFEYIKKEARREFNSPEQIFRRSGSTLCTAPSDLSSGIDWLGDLNKACAVENFVSSASSLFSAWKTADMFASLINDAGLGAPWFVLGDFSRTTAGSLGASVISMCGSGYNGFPCYPATSQAWSIGSSVGTVISTALEISKFSTPFGAVMGGLDLFCALAPQALNYYQQDYGCCKSFCNGPSCQSSTSGCTQGTGIC